MASLLDPEVPAPVALRYQLAGPAFLAAAFGQEPPGARVRARTAQGTPQLGASRVRGLTP